MCLKIGICRPQSWPKRQRECQTPTVNVGLETMEEAADSMADETEADASFSASPASAFSRATAAAENTAAEKKALQRIVGECH